MFPVILNAKNLFASFAEFSRLLSFRVFSVSFVLISRRKNAPTHPCINPTTNTTKQTNKSKGKTVRLIPFFIGCTNPISKLPTLTRHQRLKLKQFCKILRLFRSTEKSYLHRISFLEKSHQRFSVILNARTPFATFAEFSRFLSFRVFRFISRNFRVGNALLHTPTIHPIPITN